MENITLSADEKLIEAAQAGAQAESTAMNEKFRRWLEDYVHGEQQTGGAQSVMRELSGKLCVGRKLSRDETNER
jgi:hypothetical protein